MLLIFSDHPVFFLYCLKALNELFVLLIVASSSFTLPRMIKRISLQRLPSTIDRGIKACFYSDTRNYYHGHLDVREIQRYATLYLIWQADIPHNFPPLMVSSVCRCPQALHHCHVDVVLVLDRPLDSIVRWDSTYAHLILGPPL